MFKLEDLSRCIRFLKLQKFSEDSVYEMTASAIKNKITDIIEMTDDDVLRLCEMTLGITEEEENEFNVPSDIVFANTFPLHDFKLVIKFDNNKGSYYNAIEYQFNMFNLYPTIRSNGIKIDQKAYVDAHVSKVHPDKLRDYYASEKDHFHIMTSVFASMSIRPIYKDNPDIKTCLVLPIYCSSTLILTPASIFSWVADGKDVLNALADQYGIVHLMQETADELGDLIYTGKVLFYAISCALLNPIINVIFDENSNKRPIETGKATGKNKRAKIRYVKYHRIKFDDIDKAFEEKGFVRKTMVWYVTGHWREYSAGKRTFIQGYWKGPLRAVKSALDKTTPRDREIVMPDEE